MRVLITCIVRLENNYLREWINWYRQLGFTNIAIYDNNRDGEESADIFRDDFVFVHDWRNRSGIYTQNDAYQDAYDKYSSQYDWIAFFDADEYLELDPAYPNIESFLSQNKFIGVDEIRVCWQQYGNNELITTIPGDYSVQKRFKSDKNKKFYGTGITKAILRSPGNNISFPRNTHLCGHHGANIQGIIKDVNVLGQDINHNSHFIVPVLKEAWINHYVTKSLQEYITNKTKRGTPENTTYNLQEFMYVNNRYSMEELKELAKQFV